MDPENKENQYKPKSFNQDLENDWIRVSDDEEASISESTRESTPIESKRPLANEFDDLGQLLMKPVPDYPEIERTYNVWEIKNWSGLTDQKVRGPKFKVGGFEWNILLFPRGNNNSNCISVYIEPHPIEPKGDNWYVCAQFAFVLWNPANPKCSFSGSSHHRFTQNDTDWGFTSLVDLNLLYKPRNGEKDAILANNKLNITAYVKVIDDSQTGVLWYNFGDYDSKKSTNYVGLTNQGATCYLNSLLQSYFTTKAFRKLVYQIPTSSTTITKSNKKIKKQTSVAVSLQKIFYLLSTSTQAIGTSELTKAFGWDTSDAFTQHDIQELNRILMDKLETSMKGTPIENRLNDLFVGKMKSFIKCINVPYESSRVEDFWDIQLNVKGFGTLTDSFKNYIELEMLTDDNKYQAGDDYGYQDAKKGVVFESFPPVLHLQLKRFEYDFMIDDLQKINDFYQYPDQIDLSPYLDEDLPQEVKNENWNYKLHGVLVHQGSISNGHYYAMIKTKANDDHWLRFEDDKVWKVTKSQVFEENFGANELSQEEFFKLSKYEQNENLIRRSTSAYMLVYYRESELNEILPDDDEEINEHVPSFIPLEIQQHLDEMKLVEDLRLQQLYNINVKLVNHINFSNYNEFDYYYDSTNLKYYDKEAIDSNLLLQPLVLSLKKTDPVLELYKAINKQMNLSTSIDHVEDVNNLPYRLLIICHRNNQTNRADTALNVKDLLEDDKPATLVSIFNKHFNKKLEEMVFYIEQYQYDLDFVVDNTSNSKLKSIEDFKFADVNDKFNQVSSMSVSDTKPLDESSNNFILFFKFYDHHIDKLQGLTHLVIPKDSLVKDVVPKLKQLLNFDDSVELDIVEELTPTKLDKLHLDSTLEKNELGSGDVLICYVPEKDASRLLAQYIKFLNTKIHIKVRPIKEIDPSVHEINEDEDEEMSPVEETLESGEDQLDFWISTDYSYGKLSEIIGKKIGQDPEYLRLFIINQVGYKYPMNTSSNLSQYFPRSLPHSTIIQFEYEVLNISLKEFESMKTLVVNWVNKILQYEEMEIMISIDSTVADLVEKVLQTLQERKVDVSKIHKSNLLFYCGNNSKYVDYVKFNKPIKELNESFDYYLGEFPTELNVLVNYDLLSKYVDSNETPQFDNEVEQREYQDSIKYSKNVNIVPVFHFYKNSSYHHSIPFLFIIFPEESFKDTKKRLQQKLGVNDANFNKIKFALADNNDKGKYIDDDDNIILYNEITNELCNLALDHVDRNPKKSLADKGIQIK